MARPCENVNFCLFCECAYLHNDVEWDCLRDECVVNKTIVQWWEMSLRPYPLITSNPPEGKKKVKDIHLDEEAKEIILMIEEG